MTPRRGRLWAWRAASLVPALIVASFLADTSVTSPIRLEVLAVLLATLCRPALGLTLVALLAPLGDIVVPVLGAVPAHHAEALAMAFLAPWLSGRGAEAESSPCLPPRLAGAMTVFGGVLVASVVATALQLQREDPAILQQTLASLARSYLLTYDVIGAHTAAQLLEGFGLLSASAVIARRVRDRYRLRAALVLAGVAGGIATGLLVVHIAPMITLIRHAAIGTRRYSGIVGDVNATASLFVLLAGVAAGIATAATRLRRGWQAAAAALIAGLVLTGSGAGLIAAALLFAAAAMLWLRSAAAPPRKLAAGVAIAVVMVAAIAFARSPRSSGSLEMRAGFTRATLRMIEARPVFGVGTGRYYPMSKLVLSPELGSLYGRENAHDFYLQMVAENGLVGAVAFGWVLVTALSAPLRRVWRGRAGAITVGCVGGAMAYLVTGLAGHPFLLAETVLPFWIVLGLLVAPQTTAAPPPSSWPRRAALAAVGVLLLTIPFRGEVARLRLAANEDGFGPLQIDAAGRPYRDAGTYSSLFVGPTVTAVEIPVRLSGRAHADAVHLAVAVPGAFGLDVPVGRDWTMVEVPLRMVEPLLPYQRINLTATPRNGPTALTDQPVIEVGQLRLLTVK